MKHSKRNTNNFFRFHQIQSLTFRFSICTCKKRRRGLGGPLHMGVSSLEDCLQEMIPLLPEITLHPETSNSKHHKSGFCCQSTKPPLSSVFLTLTLSSPWWKSDELIFTCPSAHILYTEFNAGCPPVAAMYCCTIYFAVDDSCQMLHASAFIQNSSHIWKWFQFYNCSQLKSNKF